MASGRMLNKKIGLSKQVNDLSSDTSRLAFTWTIAHLDRDGRIHGEPDILKALVFPRRQDVSTEQMQEYIQEWGEAGLIIWYQQNGECWIQYPKFRDNQLGLRYEREQASIIPSPQGARILSGSTPDTVRTNSGNMPDHIPQNSMEFNGKEKKGIRARTREEKDPFSFDDEDSEMEIPD